MRPLATLALLTALAPALASAEVLLERVQASGYTLEEQSFAARCTIEDTGQVEIEYRAGSGLLSHRAQQMQISLATLRASIAEAYKGELVAVEPFPVDGPTRRYRAFRKMNDGRLLEVLLWEEDGNSGRKQTNTSPAATRLKRFIDLNCGPES